MKLKKKQVEMAEQLVDWWADEGFLEAGQSGRLKNSLERKSINWRKVAEYLMGLAIVSLVVAFFQLVADEWIIGLLERFFELSDRALLAFLFGLSVLFNVLTAWLQRKVKRSSLSENTLLLLGSMAFGGALYYLGQSIGIEGFWEVALVLIFALQSFGVAWLFRSVMLCDLGWVALFLWLGLESSRQSAGEGMWLGMNLPLRFLLFSLFPLLIAFGFDENKKTNYLALSAQRSGWLFFWGALWLVALFGNHSSLAGWEAASALSLLPWGLLMAFAGVGLWLVGRYRIYPLYVWMGVGSLIALGYTEFFLFLWDPLHPALFFALLGGSFWGLGRWADKLTRYKKKNSNEFIP